MASFLYRVRSGEVEGVSVDSSAWLSTAPEYAVVLNPPTPDGADLAIPKIYTGTVLRNATAGEIAGFQAAQDLDEIAVNRRQEKLGIDRRALLAVILVFRDWINANVPAAQRKTAVQLRSEILARIDAL